MARLKHDIVQKARAEWRQRRHLGIERITASGLLYSGQRERLRLWQFSHGIRLLYYGSDYQTELDVRCDSIPRLKFWKIHQPISASIFPMCCIRSAMVR
jgi:hypothetical protein